MVTHPAHGVAVRELARRAETRSGRGTSLHAHPRRAGAVALFAAATGVGLAHAADDALVHRQPAVPAAQHLLALVVIAVLACCGVAAFCMGRTGVRASLALVTGAVTLLNGSMHVIHVVVVGEVSGSDVSGVCAAVAGAVLVGMSGVLLFVHRGERDRGPVRRWLVRAAAVPLVAAIVQFVVVPVGVGIVQTHKYREPIGPSPDDRFAVVNFEASDGVPLSGWYATSQNGAAVVLVSSAAGDRRRVLRHAQMLVQSGYGVLLYDARGSGSSAGSPNGYGWDWPRDVDGALDFLSQREDVDPHRIGALGLSTGADALLEVAATDRRVRAVVADGATIRSLGDVPEGELMDRILMAPLMATVELLSGTHPGPPLMTLVPQIAPTPLLLIASGSIPDEIDLNRSYAEASREPVDLWILPEGTHVQGIRERPTEYRRRVLAHFREALLR